MSKSVKDSSVPAIKREETSASSTKNIKDEHEESSSIANNEGGPAPDTADGVAVGESEESEDAILDEETSSGDRLCRGTTKCVAQSGDHRKVVSHIFGRNKKCTRELPDNCWIKYCRKHYQRLRYRGESEGQWHNNQLNLVRQQLEDFEERANIVSWNIVLRKAEQDAIHVENAKAAAELAARSRSSKAVSNAQGRKSKSGTARVASETSSTSDSGSISHHATPATSIHGAASDKAKSITPNPKHTIKNGNTSTSEIARDLADRAVSLDSDSVSSEAESPTPAVWERFLVPYIGNNKTYDDVREVLDAIETEFDSAAFKARENKKKVFPGIEFLPNLPKPKAKKTDLAPITKAAARKTAKKAAIPTGSGKAASKAKEPAVESKAPKREPLPQKLPDTSAASTPVAPAQRKGSLASSTNTSGSSSSTKRKAPESEDEDSSDTSEPVAPTKRRRLVPAGSRPHFSELYKNAIMSD